MSKEPQTIEISQETVEEACFSGRDEEEPHHSGQQAHGDENYRSESYELITLRQDGHAAYEGE